MLLELGIDFYHYVCFAKALPFPVFGRTTKVARVCQRNVERDFRIYTKIFLLLQKRIGKTSSSESSNHILSGNDGKTLFVHVVEISARTYSTPFVAQQHLHAGKRPTKRLLFGVGARKEMQHDKMFREQIRLFRRGGGGPVLAEFEQAIGGRKRFVVQDAEDALVVCGFQGEVLEGFDHLFDRVDTKCRFLCAEMGKLSISTKRPAPWVVFWKEPLICGEKHK